MKLWLAEWFKQKWRPQKDEDVKQAYVATFSTFHGRMVIEHLITNCYATIYEGNNPIEAAHHNGIRACVHQILENIDQGEHPEKYVVKAEHADLLEGFHG